MDEEKVSWHQSAPQPCASIVRRVTPPGGRVAVIGAGASPLVGLLVEAGYSVVALDLSTAALRVLADRLPAAADVDLGGGDVLSSKFAAPVDTWHDRAVLHFFVNREDQARYVARTAAAVRQGGHVVLATFAPDGPVTCSGLPVVRYDAATLVTLFGTAFDLVDSFEAEHRTPLGLKQRFTHATFRRAFDRAQVVTA
jgi:SAM-dependent methyltransferase